MKEIQDYIYNIPKFTKKASAENTIKMLELLGNPGLDRKIIHVAGTNGKGSVCNYIDNILRAAGKNTCLFTSPHLVRLNERMVINGQEVSDELFIESFNRVKAVSEEMQDTGYVHPSFFEFLFGMAMDIFGKTNAEYIILETGLGGRLDATNVIKSPKLTVITSISYDHTDILGDTLSEIAFEKAGIIKKDIPVVFENKCKEVSDVIYDRAKKIGAIPIVLQPEHIKNITLNHKYVDFSLDNEYYDNMPFRVVSTGLYQAENAALALMAVSYLGIKDYDILKVGLLNSKWIGRMQEIMPGVILDGAHNEDGVTRFLESVKNDGCKGKRLFLFSAVKDKHYEDMIRRICESGFFSSYYTAKIDDYRGLDTEIICSEFEKNGVLPKQIYATTHIGDAFDKIINDRENADRIYIAGSLYLAGEILAYIKGVDSDD